MNQEEYLQTQQNILTVSGLIASMPLREFIAAGERADTIGPFLDPTLYREAGANLGDILDLARGLRNVQVAIVNQQKRSDK